MKHSQQLETTGTTLEQLLELHDEAFVTKVYETVLLRAADPGGLANYLGQVRAGVHKGQIILEIAESPEARRANVDLPTIHRKFATYRRRRPSIWNRLLRRLAGASPETTEGQMRVIDNQLYLLEQSLSRQEKHLADLLNHVKDLVNQCVVASLDVGESDKRRSIKVGRIPGLSPQLQRTVTELKAAIALYRGD